MFVGRPAPPDKKKEKKRSLEQGRQFLTWPTKRPEPNLVIQRSGSGWLFSVGLGWGWHFWPISVCVESILYFNLSTQPKINPTWLSVPWPANWASIGLVSIHRLFLDFKSNGQKYTIQLFFLRFIWWAPVGRHFIWKVVATAIDGFPLQQKHHFTTPWVK